MNCSIYSLHETTQSTQAYIIYYTNFTLQSTIVVTVTKVIEDYVYHNRIRLERPENDCCSRCHQACILSCPSL